MTVPYRGQSFTTGAAPGHVLIIGGGIGGLCLAQGLQKARISCAVYERERSVTDRLQGYRVHISPTGSRALHECLPPRLFDAFARTCGTGNGGAHFYTERMGTLMTVDAGDITHADSIARHRSASRITLRQVLMSDLENLHFGKAFTRYETDGDRVVAHFEDGSSAEGGLLVAADGGGSRVRRQFLPQAERIDTGVVAIGAKIFLDEAREKIDPRLLDGISLVATRGLGLFVAPQEFDGRPVGGIGGDAGVPSEAGNIFDHTRSYLMWALSGRPASLGLVRQVEEFANAALLEIAARAMKGWAKPLRALVDLCDPSTVSAFRIRTSRRVAVWPTQRITFVGDAIHAMTPYRGIGANVALKDAMGLACALTAAQRGERDLMEALRKHEAGMLDYGFRAVENSLKAMHQTLDQGPLGLLVSRTFFRIVNRLPPVKRLMAMRMGEE
jgi:salicylate hydroxylase